MVEMSPAELHRARVAADREARRVRLAGCEPASRLRDWLVFLRDGRDGQTPTGRGFESAWGEALARACTGPGAEEWRSILEGQVDVWRRAYERDEQTSAERALAVLLADLDLDRVELVAGGDDDELPGEPERVCAHCHGERGSMEGRSPKARFCSERCKRDANYQRERLRAQTTQHTRRKSSPSDIASDGAAVAVGT